MDGIGHNGGICFVAGTNILTARGEVPVEQLAENDQAILASGRQVPITWLGHRHIPSRLLMALPRLRPVCIARDAFASGRPHRDLWVSAQHGIYANGVLIAAISLVNRTTVILDWTVRDVSYYHVELESHGLLLSEGLATESYLDNGNRSFFANGPQVTSLHPDPSPKLIARQACAPRLFAGPLVEEVRQHLATRAAALRISSDSQADTGSGGSAAVPRSVGSNF